MPKGNEQAAPNAETHAALTDAPPPLVRRVLAHCAPSFAIFAYAAVIANGVLRCPMASMFHIPCPTCGATRSTLALVAGDLHGALLNPAAPLLVALVGGFAIRLVHVAGRDGHVRAFDAHPLVRAMLRAFVGVLLFATALWALRFFGLFGGPVPV